ncbi:YjjI family glycine radical enzyme [Clostridium minihomine]|uniref:YjjI family glycine radical enzyme n=1 Tax=Clostridium minihomine TaxID=2045012 RepID=UPI000C79153B|nr:YjjI family glycine radical enzyme [Clostridium minihomine]
MIDLDNTYKTLTSRELTHEQKVMGLAKCAENSLDVLNIPPRTKHFFETNAINDLFEGGAPYRPRYILPDYEKFVQQGSEFLKLTPPKTLDELIFSLMILYRHVPSITNFPVYLGSLDKMMEPFVDGLTDEEICEKLRLFLTYLDRTITDSFCHANIGPEETRAGRLILKVVKELKNTVPNLTMKYDPDITPDSFMEQAIQCSLESSNPAICNAKANCAPFGDRYGVASCYNILPIGGGAFTLTRVTLTELVKEAASEEQFLNELLPECLGLIADYMNERIRFIVEKSGFFESNFLVKEGLISKDRFVGMFGVTGLAECVNTLMKESGKKYGQDSEADDLGVRIMDKVAELTPGYKALYSPIAGDKFLLHAQVGLDSDQGITSGVRIPIGDEPVSFAEHLRHSSRFHHYFPTGVGDIFPIASNVNQNPAALLDVVKGAFSVGVQYMSFYSADTDLIRITGFLVKRSEMEKYRKHEAVLQNTTQLGAPNYDKNHLAERKVRMA